MFVCVYETEFLSSINKGEEKPIVGTGSVGVFLKISFLEMGETRGIHVVDMVSQCTEDPLPGSHQKRKLKLLTFDHWNFADEGLQAKGTLQ